ncbi:MAG TPA: type II secretion system F family protein [Pirellulales bacterium]|jgi:type II secretory pathway component PulF|nr:type II secretion system F family protein [Pirellulales bacterium]
MPDFAYTARDATGQKVSGVVSAANQREVLAQLAGKSLFPLTVDTRAAEEAQRRSTRKVKGQIMAMTYSQLSGLLKSGVPLLRSIDVLRQQASHVGLKEVLSQVYGDVEEGATLAEAMGRHPRAFSEMAVSMVRAGGEGGFLEDALLRVAQFTEQQADLKGRTIGALAYPIFLGVTGLLVVTGLIVFFVPKFENLFARLRERGELPAVTEWLLATSHGMAAYGWIPLCAIIAAVFWVKGKLQTEEGKLVRDRLQLRIPVAGRIFLNLAVARFCRVLGTLLHNGVPILRSLEISASAAGNRVLAVAIRGAAENVTEGQSLAGPLRASGHFPITVTEMIAVAEESNTLDTVLNEISEGLERRTWRQLDLMVRLLEPLMLLVLAAVILVVVIALLLPVMKMATTI